MTNYRKLTDCVTTNKNVIVRVDINVPVSGGRISDDTRIRAIIPTIRHLIENRAKIILISHFGRPKGRVVESMSLKQTVKRISELLDGKEVIFCDNCIGEKAAQTIRNADYGDVILLENLRFHQGEVKNDRDFAQQLAGFGNLYVNDAFSCSHRAHASIVGIAQILKGCAGLLLTKELDSLNRYMGDASKTMAVVGGSKVSTKLGLLHHLVKKCDILAVGGGMANTFLSAQGLKIGKSLYEKDLEDEARAIIKKARDSGCDLILPEDVVVCRELRDGAKCRIVDKGDIASDDIIVDFGAKSISSMADALNRCRNLVWNGPLGAFEFRPFNIGTENFARSVALLTREKRITSIAGGGDIVSALNSSGLIDEFSYISTAGGAFLEWLEGLPLPGVKAISS